MVSRWLHDHIQPGSVVEAAAPRGDFYLIEAGNPVVLISAGIGVTPVLAMLHALSAAHSSRDIWWLHTTRNRETQVFATEVTTLIESLPNARQNVFYTQEHNRLDRSAITALGLPADAARVPLRSNPIHDRHARRPHRSRTRSGAHSQRIVRRPPANQPGHRRRAPSASRPHPPAGKSGTGPSITFSRSGLTVNWSADYRNILDLAEACDVPTRFSCRSGVCHLCVTGVVAGTTTYVQQPLEPPAAGEVLICSAAPQSDLVLDL